MTRIVKKPDIRRAEIILAAEELFEKEGYTKTPVEAIIKKAGIAKGTFYYYFKSKHDILRAIVENIGSELEAHFKNIIGSSKLTAIEKLKLVIKGPEKKEKIKPSIMEILHKPENRELQEQINIQTVEIIAPLIAKIFEQGYKDGLFKKVISVETIQLLFAGSQFVLDSGLFNWTSKKRIAFLKEMQKLAELLTGAKSGSLSFISKE